MKLKINRFSKRLEVNFYWILILAGLGLVLLKGFDSLAAEWVTGNVNSDGGQLYKSPSGSAEILGQYPAGTAIRVYSEARNGFYSIYFAQPWKGVQYVWIPQNSVTLTASRSENRAEKANRRSDSFLKNLITVEGTGFLFQPSDFQSLLGLQSTALLGMGFGASYQRRFTSLFAASLRGGYYFFSQPLSSSTPNYTYSANGFTLILNGCFYLVDLSSFTLLVEGGAGGSLSTGGVSTSVGSISTQNIFGFPLNGSIKATYILNRVWNISLRAGYSYHVLSGVSILSSSTLAQTTTNITLSAPFATLGVGYAF